MSDEKKPNLEIEPVEAVSEDVVLTDEEITTVSAGVKNVFEAKNANNGE